MCCYMEVFVLNRPKLPTQSWFGCHMIWPNIDEGVNRFIVLDLKIINAMLIGGVCMHISTQGEEKGMTSLL